jgi:hypothetical protein
VVHAPVLPVPKSKGHVFHDGADPAEHGHDGYENEQHDEGTEDLSPAVAPGVSCESGALVFLQIEPVLAAFAYITGIAECVR